MIINKLAYCIFSWRFKKLGASFDRWEKRFEKAKPLSKMRVKCLRKEMKILRERMWLLKHMYRVYL